MNRLAPLPLVAVAALVAGCGGGHARAKQADLGCKPVPHQLRGRPGLLPSSFPSPPRVAYTSARRQGAGRLVTGLVHGSTSTAKRTYTRALRQAGYRTTSSKQSGGVTIAFTGHGDRGQVVLLQVCQGRTNVTINLHG